MDERVAEVATEDAGPAPAAAPSQAATRVERALDRLGAASERLKAFDGLIELAFEGSGRSVFVHGPSRQITAVGSGESLATLTISPDNLVRLIDGQLDPRSGLLFGQIRVSGSVPAAMRFCDAVSGVERRRFSVEAAELPKPTTDRARAKADLERFGYCLVRDALSPQKTAALRKRLRDQADGETAAGLATFDGGQKGPNQRVWALVNKGQEFVDLLDEPLIDEFVPDLLGDHAIIFSYSANIAGPGGEPQILHYDQISVQPPIPDVMVGLNIAFFLDDVTEANGGTRLAPCSGQRGMAPDDPFSTEGTIAAEGPAGTALLWDSRVWHGTGRNITDGLRHVILLYFNRHFMRAQENWALSLRDDVRAGLSDRVLTMLGYRVTNTLGGVEGPREGSLTERPKEPIGRLGPA
jgi:ectoine hydroxylase-related dioxygenase (phytanoyl-CoA dioxygenase family)